MKSDQPTAKEKRWRETVRLVGSIVSGFIPFQQRQVHHIAGRTAMVHIGPTRIGHMLILPLSGEEHRLIDRGQSGLYELKDRFYVVHGSERMSEIEVMTLHEFERYLFSRLCEVVTFPFGDEAYELCIRWHR